MESLKQTKKKHDGQRFPHLIKLKFLRNYDNGILLDKYSLQNA